MTREEMDQIWVVDGLCYRIRERYISTATHRALAAYEAARDRQDSEAIKRTSKRFAECRDADIANALDTIRSRKV